MKVWLLASVPILSIAAIGRTAPIGAQQGGDLADTAGHGQSEEYKVEPLEPLRNSREAATQKVSREVGASQKARDKALPALRAGLKASIEELKRAPRCRYLGIEDILIDPAAHADQDIATLGLAEYNSHEGYFGLVSAIAAVPVDISRMPPEERARIDSTLTYEGHNFLGHAHAAVVKGRLSGSTEKGYVVVASEVRLIPIPKSLDHLKLPSLLADNPASSPADVLTMRDRTRTALRKLRRDKSYLYVEVEDLLLSRERYSGRDIATIGMAKDALNNNFRYPYFDLTTSYHESTNRIPVLMAGLPMKSRKELLRNEDEPHLIIIRGRVEKTADDDNYHIAASGYEDLGTTSDSLAHILNPDLPALAPFDGDVKRFRKDVSVNQALPESELHDDIDRFRDKLLTTIAALKGDPRFIYAEIEDLGLAPESYLGHDVVTMGTPREVETLGAMPHFQIANSPQEEYLAIPVLMARFSPEMRKDILRVAGEDILVVRGRLDRSADQKYYIDASGYSDLGRSQRDANHKFMPLSGLLRGSAAFDAHRDDPATTARSRAVIEAVKKKYGPKYVEFKDLFRDPATYSGRDIVLTGVPFFGGAIPGKEHFYLYRECESNDKVAVVISGLPPEERKMVFKIIGEDMLAVAGRLRSSGNQTYYIEASNCTDLGPYPIPGWGALPGLHGHYFIRY